MFLQSLPAEALAKVGRVQNPLSFTRVAVQGFGRAEKESWYTRFHREYWRVRSTGCYRSVNGAGAKCKNHDKPINYTVRVMGQAFFICLGTRKLSRYKNFFLFVYFLFVCLVAAILITLAGGIKIIKFLFLFCKLFDKASVIVLACGALAMCLQTA